MSHLARYKRKAKATGFYGGGGLFDCEKQEGDELNLEVGEVITNVTQVHSYSWCLVLEGKSCARKRKGFR